MKLSKPNTNIQGAAHLPASKSESNRALIIEALLSEKHLVGNVSKAADTQTLVRILKEFREGNVEFDVGPAGTTMRFLTAFFSVQKGRQTLTGSERMKQRPISILVDALRTLGASVDYVKKEGYPPVKINESQLVSNEIEIDGGVSSQYISALMLIAPTLTGGLEIKIFNDLVSGPYLEMTASIIRHFGGEVMFSQSSIRISPKKYNSVSFSVESDWSAASYWYEIVAFSDTAEIELKGLKKDSLQGDSIVVEIFKNFGVETNFTTGNVILKKVDVALPALFEYDFTLCPDLAQTIAVTCVGLGVEAKLTGLKTLKIKETDRIVALQNELRKFGVQTEGGESWLKIQAIKLSTFNLELSTPVETYEDHRMAMAFAPLALKCGVLEIENPEVVEKSYPSFWKDLEQVGFLIEK
ncbi:MAG: 3-phosphoshikimate 1-carboxyvinyltransferase [Flavobacteriales bacterium]|nr:3-phosphoshikimate 1-carboxyvinyltransferase [Flavobacteriales bacterium]